MNMLGIWLSVAALLTVSESVSGSAHTSPVGPNFHITGNELTNSGLGLAAENDVTTAAPTTPAPTVAPAREWFAVFYNNSLKSWLNQTFESRSPISARDISFNKVECDHTTVTFNPPNLSAWTPFMGAIDSAHILGYAHDEHGQAILVHYDQDAPQSTNDFPHVTISHQNSDNYSAAYSNDLWARVAASGLVSVTLDSFGKPVTVAPAPDTGLTWTATSSLPFAGVTAQFNLGSFPSTVNSAIYAPTTVQVTLFTTPVAGLQGQYCQASKWTGGVTGVCAGVTPAPTTPSPTGAPTTMAPTTVTPTTVAPTTPVPTTATPTTPAPPAYPQNPCVRQTFGGILDAYNLFLVRDWTSTAGNSVEGAMLVGGNVNLASYDLARTMPASQINMVVGGDLTLNQGSFTGKAIVQGAVKVNNLANTNNIIGPNATLPPPFGSTIFQFQQWIAQQFAQELIENTLYGHRLPNCDSQVTPWNTWIIKGIPNQMCRVVSTTAIFQASNIQIYGDNTTMIVVILDGDNWSWQYKGMDLYGLTSSGPVITASQLLWVAAATRGSINMNGIGFHGTLLAPDAKITLNYGRLNGQLIAHSFQGSGTLTNQLFCQITVPPQANIASYIYALFYTFPSGDNIDISGIQHELAQELASFIGLPSRYVVVQLIRLPTFLHQSHTEHTLSQRQQHMEASSTTTTMTARIVIQTPQSPTQSDYDLAAHGSSVLTQTLIRLKNGQSQAQISSVNMVTFQNIDVSQGFTVTPQERVPTYMCANGMQSLSPCDDTTSSSTTTRNIIIGSVVGGVVALGIIALLIIVYHRYHRASRVVTMASPHIQADTTSTHVVEMTAAPVVPTNTTSAETPTPVETIV